MSYTEPISPQNPGLLVFLLDQSGSMSANYGNQQSAEAATDAINHIIYEILQSNLKGNTIKPSCYISVIGYGAPNVAPLVHGRIDEFPQKTLGNKQITRQQGVETVTLDIPVWVNPIASEGTPMAEAFEAAYQLIDGNWINNSSKPERKSSFPPVVINVTDGAPDDELKARRSAQRLTELATSDGNVLLFNIHIANQDGSANSREPIIYPNQPNNLDNSGKFLFNITSLLPEKLSRDASAAGFHIEPGARGFVYNAPPLTFVKALTFASVGSMK
jgi:uncharacterized protein YegL